MNAHADAHIRRLGQSGRVLSLTSGASYHALVDLFSFRNSRLLRVRIALGRTGRDAQSRDEQAEQTRGRRSDYEDLDPDAARFDVQISLRLEQADGCLSYSQVGAVASVATFLPSKLSVNNC